MVDFGDILIAVGDFGSFQKLLLLGLCMPCVLLPMTFTNLLFIQSDPVRRCNTDWILKADPNLTPEEQANLTLPRVTDGTFSRCEMFVPVDWDIDAIRDDGLNETTECQNGWVYDRSMYEATIVTDFDLVCSRSNLAEVAQTVFMAGCLAGTFIFGPVAESYGRQRATQIPVALFFIFTITAGLSPGLYTYMTSQFIVGAAAAGYRVNAPVLATEWIGVSRRSLASCLSQMCAAVGQCIMSGLVYVIRDWRLVQYAMAGPLAVVFIYIWFIPESARWLLAQGRRAESNALLLKVAAINGTPVPETLLAEVTEGPKKQTEGIKLLFTSPVLIKRIVIISFTWASLSLGYFCLSLNVGKLGLNIFVVQFLFGVTEIPANLLCIWFLEVFGRKISLTFTLLAGGFFCLLTLAFPQDSVVTITALATVGRFFMSWAGSVSMLYSQELFPTSLRQTAVALASIGYRLAGLLSPSLNLLALYHWAVPTSVFGSLAIISGTVAFLLPETRRTELPDSTDEPMGKRNITSVKNGTLDVSNLNTSITSTKL